MILLLSRVERRGKCATTDSDSPSQSCRNLRGDGTGLHLSIASDPRSWAFGLMQVACLGPEWNPLVVGYHDRDSRLFPATAVVYGF